MLRWYFFLESLSVGVQNKRATALQGGEVDNSLLQLQRSIFA